MEPPFELKRVRYEASSYAGAVPPPIQQPPVEADRAQIYLSLQQMQYLGILEAAIKNGCRLVEGNPVTIMTKSLTVTLSPVPNSLAPEQEIKNVLQYLLQRGTIFAYAKGEEAYQFHIRIRETDGPTQDSPVYHFAEWITSPLLPVEQAWYQKVREMIQKRMAMDAFTTSTDLAPPFALRVLETLLLKGEIRDWASIDDSEYILKVSDNEAIPTFFRELPWRTKSLVSFDPE